MRTYSLLAVLALLAGGAFAADAAARESTCPELIKPQGEIEVSGLDGVPPGLLEPVNSEAATIGKPKLTMDFGSGRERSVRTQTYRLSGEVAPETIRVSTINDFVDGNTVLPIGHDQMTYRAGLRQAGRGELVHVRVCYDPGGFREPKPGRYSGALLVSGDNAESVLAVELTFRDDNLFWVIVALLLGIGAGVLLQVGVLRQQAPANRTHNWRAYLFNFRIVIAMGAGVAAAIGAYSQLVAGDPTWDGSLGSLFKLTTTTFGATVAAKAFADLKGPTETERREGLAR
jgi:hypothetical protein